jgi:hypothetical protein
VWEGAYVFTVTTTKGFELKGRISHTTGSQLEDYWRADDETIYRSFYISNVIYTVSRSKITGHDMNSVSSIFMIELPYEGSSRYYY